jgi:hypothetical protein
MGLSGVISVLATYFEIDQSCRPEYEQKEGVRRQIAEPIA